MGRVGTLLVAALGVLLVVAAVGVAILTREGPLSRLGEPTCTATVRGHAVTLDLEQADNAVLIAAISVQRGLPARAASIALATAYQESDLYNLEHGDRDSLGLFQQRPSQGWGTPAQVRDPHYATNAFYDALVEVDGYESMEITDAAQEVQRSAFPDAYADHEADARVLASALTGETPGGRFSCEASARPGAASALLDESGLTPRAAEVRSDLEAAYGALALGGFAAGGVSSGHMEGSTHYDGRAIDVFVRPVSPANRRRGWAIAQYLVGRAERLGIQTVIFDGRIWTARSADDGWRRYRPQSSSGDRAVLMHRDHVHVDVFG